MASQNSKEDICEALAATLHFPYGPRPKAQHLHPSCQRSPPWEWSEHRPIRSEDNAMDMSNRHSTALAVPRFITTHVGNTKSDFLQDNHHLSPALTLPT
jgi:hypothetical protein